MVCEIIKSSFSWVMFSFTSFSQRVLACVCSCLGGQFRGKDRGSGKWMFRAFPFIDKHRFRAKAQGGISQTGPSDRRRVIAAAARFWLARKRPKNRGIPRYVLPVLLPCLSRSPGFSGDGQDHDNAGASATPRTAGNI